MHSHQHTPVGQGPVHSGGSNWVAIKWLSNFWFEFFSAVQVLVKYAPLSSPFSVGGTAQIDRMPRMS